MRRLTLLSFNVTSSNAVSCKTENTIRVLSLLPLSHDVAQLICQAKCLLWMLGACIFAIYFNDVLSYCSWELVANSKGILRWFHIAWAVRRVVYYINWCEKCDIDVYAMPNCIDNLLLFHHMLNILSLAMLLIISWYSGILA